MTPSAVAAKPSLLPVLALVVACSAQLACSSEHQSVPDAALSDAGPPDAPPLTNGELAWAKQAGGSGYEWPASVATFDDGSWIAAFSGDDAVFGGGEANETTLAALQHYDLFLARYEPDGTLLWAKLAGSGPGEDDVRDFAVFPDESSVVLARYRDTITFGLGTPNETTLTRTGRGLFVAKFDASGDVVWARDLAALADELVTDSAIAAFPDGTSLVARGAILIRLDVAGLPLWTRTIDGPNDRYVWSADTLADGGTLVAGEFAGTATFGVGTSTETTLTADTSLSYQMDAFVAAYDADGGLSWARRVASGAGREEIRDILAMTDGRFAVAGSFGNNSETGTSTFGPDQPDSVILSSVGLDMFVAQFDSAGLLEWVRAAQGAGNDWGQAIDGAADGSEIVVTGSFGFGNVGTLTLGEGETNETTLTNANGAEALVASFSADGQLRWVRQASATGEDIARFSDGSLVFTGKFGSTATFGPGEQGSVVLTALGDGSDVFFAKLLP